jgi:FKBP-type peptidyl-prolyl cis-trans isomerase FkpA
MKQAQWLVGTLVVMGLVACEQSKTPKTDQEKYSYSIGYQFAKNLKQQNVDVDIASLKTAISDAQKGKESQVSDEEMQRVMQKMYEERSAKMNAEAGENIKKSKEWLEANKSKEGVKTTPSGLQYKMITEGSGPNPKDSDIVVVHYKGTLIDGTEFDSSYKRNQPAEFPLKAVIPGWTEGLQLMKKGGKANFFIPPELAYGERGRPSIPANSALVFEVELIDIKAPPAEGKPNKPAGEKPAKPAKGK